MISVIITTYRDEAFRLYKSIYSVLKQTLPADEIIVIDDCSKHPFDGLNKLLKNTKIKWIINSSNQGVAISRNLGATIAQADLLCFLDAGDWWHREKLKQQSQYMNARNLDACFTGRIDWISNRLFSIQTPKKVFNYRRAFLIKNSAFFPSSMMINKEVFENLGGFFQDYDIPEDRDLGYRLAKSNHRIDFLSRPLFYYEVSFQSRSADAIKKQKTYMDFIKLHLKDIIKEQILNDVLAEYFKNIALKYFYTLSYKNSVAWIYKSFQKKHSIKTLFQLLIFSVFGIFCLHPKYYYIADAFMTYARNLHHLKSAGIISEVNEFTMKYSKSSMQILL